LDVGNSAGVSFVSAVQALIDEPGQAVPSFAFRPRLRVGSTTAAH